MTVFLMDVLRFIARILLLPFAVLIWAVCAVLMMAAKDVSPRPEFRNGLKAAVLLMAVLAAGCVTKRAAIQHGEQMFSLGRIGCEAEHASRELVRALENWGRSQKAVEDGPLGDKAIDREFEDAARDAECETDLKLSGDPDTPDEIRKILLENVKRCRTRRQENALDRISERKFQ